MVAIGHNAKRIKFEYGFLLQGSLRGHCLLSRDGHEPVEIILGEIYPIVFRVRTNFFEFRSTQFS